MTYMTVAESADYLRRHPVTVRKSLEAGDLHGLQRKARGHWLVKTECADSFIEGKPCEHQLATVTPITSRRRTA